MEGTIGGEDRVMATAQQIVKSLNASKDVTEDMIMILSSFDNRLVSIVDLMSNKSEEDDSKVENRLKAAEKVIFRWDLSNGDSSGHWLPWEENSDDVAEYLSAVDEIIKLREDVAFDSVGDSILGRIENARESAMSRFEAEFRHVLIRNTVNLDAERLYGSIRRGSRSWNEGEIQEFEGFVEGEEQMSFSHERGGSLAVDFCVDLIVPEAVGDLKEIADRMIRSGYDNECRQVYMDVRRSTLEECIPILGVEKLGIEEVQKIEWRSLDEKMKKWIRAFKVVVRILLTGEKQLCDHIFSGSELIKDECFIDTAKGCVMQLLNFGEAVAIGRRSAEKLFRFLDMYDVLGDLLPALQALFTAKSGEFLCSEANGVLNGLAEVAIGTFLEFENAVQGEQSRRPIQNGEIHPLTRYVMNYMRLLGDYSDTLNVLLKNCKNTSDVLLSEDGDCLDLENMSALSCRLLSLISLLESNLQEKSRLYEDVAIQYIFLMNNILYIVQKVKDSELRNLLGDQWIRKHRGQIRQYATKYLRASWGKGLVFLKDEGIGGTSGSVSKLSKVALKEKFKNFNAYFEDIYRTQTAWKVPDPQLREELRISISEKVIPAYRSFMGRFGSHLENGKNSGKYIKYTPDDLEAYLVDLFEGTPLLLHMRRRST